MVLGRAVPDPDLSAVQRRESARVGAREQQVPGVVVEAALGPSDPPAVVELDAPDEGPPAVGARLLPVSGQGQEG